MVNLCCVRGCLSDSRRKSGLRFFRFPEWKRSYGPQMEDVSRRRRAAWVSAVGLHDLTFDYIPKHRRVCSLHFHSGKPSYEMMETDPDWAPSLHLGHSEAKTTDAENFERRVQREQQRVQLRRELEATREARREATREARREATREARREATREAVCEAVREVTHEAAYEAAREAFREAAREASREAAREAAREVARQVAREAAQETIHKIARAIARKAQGAWDPPERKETPEEKPRDLSTETPEEKPRDLSTETPEEKPTDLSTETFEEQNPLLERPLLIKTVTTMISGPGPDSAQAQTECDMCVMRRDEINRLLEENRQLRQQLSTLKFSEGFFTDGDDNKVKYYTGLPSYAAFTELLTRLPPLVTNCALSPFQMLLMTLMRLRLDPPVQLVATLFFISPGTVYRVFKDTVSSLYAVMKDAVVCVDRDAVMTTLPRRFVDVFGDRAVVFVDTFEIVTEKPSAATARSRTFSGRRQAHTVKYLVAATPGGATCFLSSGRAGGTDDRELLLESGLLRRLREGDVLLGRKGFGEGRSSGMWSAEVTCGDDHEPRLVPRDSRDAEKILQVRTDVKKTFLVTCQKYRILSSAVPTSLTAPQDVDQLTLLDKMVTVCYACTDLCPTAANHKS